MGFAKIEFRVAGIYGLLVLVPALFLEARSVRRNSLLVLCLARSGVV
jgi:hypothetical protein